MYYGKKTYNWTNFAGRFGGTKTSRYFFIDLHSRILDDVHHQNQAWPEPTVRNVSASLNVFLEKKKIATKEQEMVLRFLTACMVFFPCDCFLCILPGNTMYLKNVVYAFLCHIDSVLTLVLIRVLSLFCDFSGSNTFPQETFRFPPSRYPLFICT